MTNPYFSTYSALPRNQTARAEAINAIIDAVIVGFDNVPTALSIANAAAIANGILATVAQWAVATGLVNAPVGAYPTTVTSLTDGLLLGFRANLSNTNATPTFKADATTARTITRDGGQALIVGDIIANGEYLLRYNLANTRWELLNPATPIGVAWPSFLAYLSASTAAVTGDGTLYDVTFDTVEHNVGTAYGTGTNLFTAPVAGEYEFAATVNFTTLGAGHTEGRIDIVCSGGQVVSSAIDSPGIRRSGANQAGYSIGRVTVVLAAAETVKIRAVVYNSTKTIPVLGGHNPSYSWFSGRRVK